jgi:hypothetical protein
VFAVESTDVEEEFVKVPSSCDAVEHQHDDVAGLIGCRCHGLRLRTGSARNDRWRRSAHTGQYALVAIRRRHAPSRRLPAIDNGEACHCEPRFRRNVLKPSAALFAMAAVAACTSGPTAEPSPASSGTVTLNTTTVAPNLSGTTEPPGCDGTPVSPGSEAPSWAVGGAPFLRFVQSAEGNAVGFLFADPLRAAPRTDDHNNKILWVVREPRNGYDLHITGRNGNSQFTFTKKADSFPGEIYPSFVDAPSAGCWHLTLEWAQSVAHVNLRYLP